MDAAPPKPVTLIVGVLSAEHRAVDWAVGRLTDLYGPVEARSPEWPFDFTRYYEKEMGAGLRRLFLSFARRVDPGELAAIKLQTNALESEARSHSRIARPVNLDPGYVTDAKLVLATTKDYCHRVYVGRGIYAEVTLVYTDGDFRPQPWTYRDYRTEKYLAFFRGVRAKHVENSSQ